MPAVLHEVKERVVADNSNARSVDQTFNMFGVLLNFLVTPAETGHEVSLFKGILPPGVVIPQASLLVQVGLPDPANLPLTGIEQARSC